MPLGNEGRASRRPMPRQLDMSSWGADSSSTSVQDRFRNEPTESRRAIDFNYSKASELPSRFDNFREEEYRPRQISTREELSRLHEGREPRTNYSLSGLSSERSTARTSSLDAPFTSFTSTRDSARGTTSYSHRGDHDNQRDVDDFSRYRSSGKRGQGEQSASESTNRGEFRQDERSDDNMSSGSNRAAECSNARSSFKSASFGTFSSFSSGKADSVRAAESPVAARMDSSVLTSTHINKEPTCKTSEFRLSSLASDQENQEELPSPTNSETSVSPSSPESEHDSIAHRIRSRYPKPSIPSPVSSDRSDERNSPMASPCSSVSTCNKASTKTKSIVPSSEQFDVSKRGAESAMSDLREDLYAFRKQMREVFIRVEDMVDVHRSFFKSDPSTGSPVFNADLQQEAEKLATQAFEQLSDLRKQFTRLATDFQRTEEPRDERSGRDHERKQPRLTTTRAPPRSRREQPAPSRRAVSSHGSDDERISVKGSVVSDDDGSDRDSSDERPREHSSRIPLARLSSQADSDDDDAPPATMPDSARSTTSPFLSSQLQSRWGNSGGSNANGSDISSRSRGRSPSIVSDVSSLPDQCSRPTSKTSMTDSIFQDFDKRMEEIRCSLNAIASGKKPHRTSDSTSTGRVAAVSPKNFKHGARMDSERTRSTLREASRISTSAGLDVERSDGNSSEAKPPRGAREAELRQLLKQLNQLNGDKDADD